MLQAAGASLFASMAGCTSLTGSDEPTGTEPPETGGEGETTATAAGTETVTPQDTETGTETSGSGAETTLLSDFENLSNWNPQNAKLSGAKNAYAGSTAAKLVRQNGGEMSVSRQVDLDLTDQNVSLAVKTKAQNPVVFDVFLDAPDPENRLILTEGVRSSVGSSYLRIDPGAARVRGLPDLKKVKRITIRPRGGDGAGTTVWLDDLRLVPSPKKPYVVLTFDDGYASHYTEAFKLMSKHDMPGFAAVPTGHVGTKGNMNLEQMQEMKKGGWEFGSHSKDHTKLTNLSRLEAEEQIVDAKQWLIDNGFETGAQYIAYPQGKYDAPALNFIKQHHDMGFRYIGPKSAGSGRITEAMTASRGAGHRVEDAKEMVDVAALYNDLAIFTFHRIGTDQAQGTPVPEFKEFLRHVRDSKAQVIPISAVQKNLLSPISPGK